VVDALGMNGHCIEYHSAERQEKVQMLMELTDIEDGFEMVENDSRPASVRSSAAALATCRRKV
jgi:hypothetical protein